MALVFVATATPAPARAQPDTTPEPDVGVSVLPRDLAVAEGQSRLVSVALKSRPTAAVVVRLWRDSIDHIAINRVRLRFTPQNWDRPRKVRLLGRQDADAVDDVTTFTLTASGGNYDAMENFVWRVRTIDDEEIGVAVTPADLAVAEGQSRLVSVALKSRPTAAVVVRLWRDSIDHIAINRVRLRFTPQNWDRPRKVRLLGRQDADAVDDVTTFTLTASGGNYDAMENFVWRVRTIDDEDVPAVVVSAVDAGAREGPRAEVSFPVRLSRAAQVPVSVRYATSDGTARAGEDYVATSETLTFQPGDMELPVAVPILDDAKDEGEETFFLTLSDPSGATLGDAIAVGTIVNADPLPREWNIRFGRTVAAQAVDAIGARVSGAQGTQIVIAGTNVERSGSVVVDPRVRGRAHHSSATGNDSPGFENRDGSRAFVRGPDMTARRLALTSGFRIGSEPAEDGPVWTTWGRFAATDVESSAEGFALDDDVATGFLGFDVVRERWLAGVAMSLSRGDGSFEPHQTRGAGGVGVVGIESRLASLYPYARYRLGERIDVWAMVGYGTGELKLTEPAGGNRARDVVTTTGMEMRMGALGARGTVVSPEEPGGLEVAVRTDAFRVRTRSDAVASARSRLAEASAGDASRVRLLLEGSRTIEVGDSGTTFTPSAEVGMRHDGGDGETGAGIVAGVGARLSTPGVAVDVAVRSLVAHDERDHEGWGVSGSIRVDPGAAGRGLSLSIAPRWGASGYGAERLWSLHHPAGVGDRRSLESEPRLAAELGYGLPAPAGRGVLTPYMGAAWFDDGAPRYRLGAHWNITPRATVELEGTHRETGGEGGSENVLALRARLRW